MFPHSAQHCERQPTASLEKPSARSSPLKPRGRHFSLSSFQPPFLVTLLAQIDRTSCSSFCHNGRKLVELEALFSTLVVAHLEGPTRLTGCTQDEPQLLFAETQSCFSDESTRITTLPFCGGALACEGLCSFFRSRRCVRARRGPLPSRDFGRLRRRLFPPFLCFPGSDERPGPPVGDFPSAPFLVGASAGVLAPGDGCVFGGLRSSASGVRLPPSG